MNGDKQWYEAADEPDLVDFGPVHVLSLRSLAEMDVFMRDKGLVANGLHHEVYLSDVRETDPEKIRTILRQPVRAA